MLYNPRRRSEFKPKRSSIKGSRIALNLLAFLVMALRQILKGLYAAIVFFASSISPAIFNLLWRFALLPTYKTILKTKFSLKRVLKTLLPVLANFPVKEKYIWIFAFFALSIGISLHNINYGKVRAEDIGRNSLFFRIIAPQDQYADEIIIEGAIQGGADLNRETLGLTQGALTPEITPQQTAPFYPTYDYISQDIVLKQPITIDLNSPQRDYSIPRYGIETYIVQERDTISAIADKFNISVNTILWENNLRESSILRPGQKFSILPVTGVKHKIKQGENIAKIASLYSVETQDIVEANHLSLTDTIKKDEYLIIPDGKPLYSAPSTPSPTRLTRIRRILSIEPQIRERLFSWPTTSRRITQSFRGWRHSGIDISNRTGEPVFAAASGIVETSERTRWGYGAYIIIRHSNGFSTLYGHNSKNIVTVGQRVERGQVIGLVGSTGRSTGPHVHFEVRSGGNFLNPFNYF